jgi:RNA polymerase sigma factor (sigma-70 family)
VADRGAANGRDAWEKEISAMAPPIHYYLLKNYPITEEQAEDLVQDTMRAAIEKVREPGFALKPGTQLTTFVHSIAKHKALDFLKGQRVRKHTPIDDEMIAMRLVVDSSKTMTEADVEKLRKLIDRLEEPKSRILYFIYFGGYKVAEVSAEMNMPPAQVSTLKFAALRQLREWCEEEGLSLAILMVAGWNLWRLIHGL